MDKEHLIKAFYRYIQNRMDFIAQITTEIPQWTHAAWFHKEIMREFLDQFIFLDRLNISENLRAYKWPKDPNLREMRGKLIIRLAAEKSRNNKDEKDIKWILDEYKCTCDQERKKEICRTEHPDNRECRKLLAYRRLYGNIMDDDFLISVPGGIVGYHALYVILENIIRNEAKHNYIKRIRYDRERGEIVYLLNSSGNEQVELINLKTIKNILQEINKVSEKIGKEHKKEINEIKEKVKQIEEIIRKVGNIEQVGRVERELREKIKDLKNVNLETIKNTLKEINEVSEKIGKEHKKEINEIKEKVKQIEEIIEKVKSVVVKSVVVDGEETIEKIKEIKKGFGIDYTRIFVLWNKNLMIPEPSDDLQGVHYLTPLESDKVRDYIKFGMITELERYLSSIPLRINVKITDDENEKDFYWITVWSDMPHRNKLGVVYKDNNKIVRKIITFYGMKGGIEEPEDNNLPEDIPYFADEEVIKELKERNFRQVYVVKNFSKLREILRNEKKEVDTLNFFKHVYEISIDEGNWDWKNLVPVWIMLNHYLERPIIDSTGKLNKSAWGMAEMKIAALYLQKGNIRILGYEADYFTKKNITENVIEALPVDRDGCMIEDVNDKRDFYFLGFRFKVLRPREIAISLKRSDDVLQE